MNPKHTKIIQAEAENSASKLYDGQSNIISQISWSDCKDSFLAGAAAYERLLLSEMPEFDDKLFIEKFIDESDEDFVSHKLAAKWQHSQTAEMIAALKAENNRYKELYEDYSRANEELLNERLELTSEIKSLKASESALKERLAKLEKIVTRMAMKISDLGDIDYAKTIVDEALALRGEK
jgi:uncharacterized membrane-anchored protein YhcB (DUF1043 family)